MEPTASTQPQQDLSGGRPATRGVALLASAVTCAALLSAVTLFGAGSATASPAVTPAYVTTANVSDPMDRTVAVGFGTANQGGSYATSPSTRFSVSNGEGHISAVPSGTGARATLSVVSAADQQLESRFSLPKLPASGNGIYYQLEFRRQSNGDNYHAQVRISPTGQMSLSFAHILNGVPTTLGLSFVSPQLAAAGNTIMFQGLVAGSSAVTLRARAWLAGTTDPGWQLGASDSTSNRLSTAGQVGLNVYMSASSPAAAVTVASLSGWSLTTPPPAPVKPGPTNTGVPTGTVLSESYGNLTITVAGTTLDALDVHGFLTIKAANVTIKRSIIRGGVATSGNPGIVTDTDAAGTNFILADSEIVPEYPSVAIDGVRGANFTLTRVNVHGTVDAAKVIGNNVTIQSSWLHDTTYYTSDPYQRGGPSHNDGVQVLSGTKIRLLNNTIAGNDNSAVQVTQGAGVVSDLWINGNWADGGGCTVNINNKPLASMNAVTANNNRFGHATRVSTCPIIASRAVQLSASGNVYDDTGLPALVRDGG